jgi:hypothetical protein
LAWLNFHPFPPLEILQSVPKHQYKHEWLLSGKDFQSPSHTNRKGPPFNSTPDLMEVDAAFHYKIEPSCYCVNAQLIPLVKISN